MDAVSAAPDRPVVAMGRRNPIGPTVSPLAGAPSVRAGSPAARSRCSRRRGSRFRRRDTAGSSRW